MSLYDPTSITTKKPKTTNAIIIVGNMMKNSFTIPLLIEQSAPRQTCSPHQYMHSFCGYNNHKI